jgi:hypothetical protein
MLDYLVSNPGTLAKSVLGHQKKQASLQYIQIRLVRLTDFPIILVQITHGYYLFCYLMSDIQGRMQLARITGQK